MHTDALLGAAGFFRRPDVGYAVSVFLILLLTGKELLRAHGGFRAMRLSFVATIASLPVIAVFACVVVSRLTSAIGK